MATGWSGSSGSSSTTTTSQPFTVMTPNTSDVRQKLVDLIGTTTAAYNQLMQNGRDNDAFALRDAMERLSRASGVSSWARTQAIKDLRARMAAAARTLQGTTTAAGLAMQVEILGKIAGVDVDTFNQALQANQFSETQKQNTWERTNAYNQQQAALAAQKKAAIPVSTSSADADARMKAMQQPVATPKTTNAFTQPAATPYQFNWNVSPYQARPGEPAMGRQTLGYSAGIPIGTTSRVGGRNWGI